MNILNSLNKLHEKLWQGFDRQITSGTRGLAKRVSRRGFVGRLGALLVGTGALPLLPVVREAAAASGIPEMGDPQSCD